MHGMTQCCIDRAGLDEDTILELCESAPSSVPTECVVLARKGNIPLDVAVDICKGASSTAAVSCFKKVRVAHLENEMKATLCHQAESEAPAECANKAPYALDNRLVVELCVGATSAQPATCLNKIKSHRWVWLTTCALCAGWPPPFLPCPRHTVALCHSCVFVVCARVCDCACVRVRLCVRVRVRVCVCLCVLTHVEGCCRLSDAQQVRVCRGAVSTAPAQCMANVPFGLHPTLAVRLCSGASTVGPATCLRILRSKGGTMHAWSDDMRVSLCRHVRSDDAAASVATCAASAGPQLSPSTTIELCRQSTTGCSSPACRGRSHTALDCFHAFRSHAIPDMVKAAVCSGAFA